MTKTARDLLKQALDQRVMDEPRPGKPWATADQLLAKLESAQRRDEARGKRARGR